MLKRGDKTNLPTMAWHLEDKFKKCFKTLHDWPTILSKLLAYIKKIFLDGQFTWNPEKPSRQDCELHVFFPKDKLHILHYHFGSTELLVTQYLNPSPEHKDTQDNSFCTKQTLHNDWIFSF